MNLRENAMERRLARALRRGDGEALAALFAMHQPRLAQLAKLSLDPRLTARVDSDDVLQEAYLAALARLGHFDARSERAPFVWLRMILGQTLADIRRRHLGTQSRAVGREVSLPEHTRHLIEGRSHAGTGPDRTEDTRVLLGRLTSIDREILLLRHEQGLSNDEAAAALGIKRTAANNRYVRAMTRLRRLALSPVPAAAVT